MFRTMVYAETEEQFTQKEADMREDPVFQKYKNYQNYVENMMERKEEWSLVYRINEKLPTSNHNTTNLVETSFRREKDNVFNRHRAYNLTDMVQTVIDSSEGYSMRCVDAANHTLHQRLKNQNSQYLIKKTKIDPPQIKQVDKESFEVPSETKTDVVYHVNLRLRLCTCPRGQLKGPCKHKSLVSSTFDLPNYDAVPESPEMRASFMYLGTGKHINPEWFCPLKSDIRENCSRGGKEKSGGGEEGVGLDEGAGQQECEEGQRSEDNEVCPNEDNSSQLEALKEKLQNSMETFRAEINLRIEGDIEGYKTAIEVFSRQLEKLGKVKRDSALQKTLCSFGKSVTESLSQGKKKKLGRIPVQVTARSRRTFRLRGSRMAIMGAPTKTQAVKRQLEVDDKDETLRHILPKLKKKKTKQKHSLKTDVEKNQRCSKKH